MKYSLLFLSSLVTCALSIPESEWATNPPTLDIEKPIYLASAFFPPQMRFALWTPPKTPFTSPSEASLHWCRNGLDVTDSLSSGSRTPTFELEGLEGLKIHDFFTDQAYLSRWNTRFAECVVTPESRMLGRCDSHNEPERDRFLGVGHLVWSCWVIKTPDRKHVLGPKEDSVVEGITIVDARHEAAEKTGAVIGGSSSAAFTAAVTGS